MPVYGKGRKIKPTQRGKIERIEGEIKVEKIAGYILENSSLRKVEKNLYFNISGFVKDLIDNGKKPVVMDWGCAKGKAAAQLGKKFSETKVFGVSDVAYKSWKRSKNVNFIHETKEDALRYFKNGSIDLIYSHYGLSWIKEIDPYLEKLLPKLKKGGKLVSDSIGNSEHRLFNGKRKINGLEYNIKTEQNMDRFLTWHITITFERVS